MVIIYKVGKIQRKLSFSEDGMAWKIRIPNRDRETATVHIIPKKDIIDIRVGIESGVNRMKKEKTVINPLTGV